jgi:hypothetical protein
MSDLEINWSGPYAWPGYEAETGLPPVPEHGGVYLRTFECQDGYVIQYIGETALYPKRLEEHRRGMLDGNYVLLDMDAAAKGVYSALWPYQGRNARPDDFELCKDEIRTFARWQMAKGRVFVTDQEMDKRLRLRLEAAIATSQEHAAQPAASWAPKIRREPRRADEEPIMVRISTSAKLIGMPATIEI